RPALTEDLDREPRNGQQRDHDDADRPRHGGPHRRRNDGNDDNDERNEISARRVVVRQVSMACPSRNDDVLACSEARNDPSQHAQREQRQEEDGRDCGGGEDDAADDARHRARTACGEVMPPYLRSRFWYASTDSSRWRRRKSGQSVSVT